MRSFRAEEFYWPHCHRLVAPITAAPGLPSCADTAARRCSSSRPSRALSTSAALRVHRFHHDRHRINQQNFPGGICINYAVANPLVLVLQNDRVLPPQSPLDRLVPLRAWHATDTHRSRSRDNLRPTGFCQRSNPHRSASLLIGISTSPRFPPSGLAQRLPSDLSAHAGTSVHGQASGNP